MVTKRGPSRFSKALAPLFVHRDIRFQPLAPRRAAYAHGPGETTYYIQWEHETRRDHIEYERRKTAEQREYWEWRKHHHHD